MSQEHIQTPSSVSLSETVPLIEGTMGPSAFELKSLQHETGLFSYDPGFGATASCQSAITYIDGERGILLHRGYPIEELAQHINFTEMSYLLLYGDLPASQDYETFRADVVKYRLLNEQIRNFISGFRRDTHPMAILCGTVAALASFYHDGLQTDSPAQRDLSARRLIAKMPTIAAWAYKYTIGEPFIYPDEQLSYAENLLHMLFGRPGRAYRQNPILTRALDRILLLHADHEQNASTTAVRLVGSTGANPFACISAGIAALWGPAHGGANEAVLAMFGQIGDKENIPAFLQKVKEKQPGVRLMGFGHRVYRNIDPRSKLIQASCHEVIQTLGLEHDPMLDLAMELERIALNDSYFISRKLYPNVDFYSGLILKALGIPPSLFTVLFAVARTAGWVSHWLEMSSDNTLRITRPRQIYTGPTLRHIPSEHHMEGNP